MLMNKRNTTTMRKRRISCAARYPVSLLHFTVSCLIMPQSQVWQTPVYGPGLEKTSRKKEAGQKQLSLHSISPSCSPPPLLCAVCVQFESAQSSCECRSVATKHPWLKHQCDYCLLNI